MKCRWVGHVVRTNDGRSTKKLLERRPRADKMERWETNNPWTDDIKR